MIQRMGTRTTILAIAVLGLSLLAASSYAQYPYPDTWGHTPLFSGKDLTGWKMQWPGLWEVKRGAITGKQDPATGGDSWLFTEQEWDDFSLYLNFKVTPNCNSGVGVRMPSGVEGRPSQHGFEIQISDNDTEFPTGSIFRKAAATPNVLKTNEWNELGIVCFKNHIVVYLNKIKVTDARVEGSLKGRIGLQVHGTEKFKDQVVEFKDIRIRDLKPQLADVKESPIKFKTTQIDKLNSEGCAIVDVNRDGKLDITCGPNWYEAPNWTAHPLRECILSGEFMNNYGEIAMDVNYDGWPDIISGGWFIPKLAWYENPGADGLKEGKIWKEHVIGNDLDGTEGIIGCDVDRDGRNDIMVNFYNTALPIRYYAYVGLDKSESGFELRILGHEGRGHGGGFGDINGDGRGDALITGGWYESPLDPKAPWKFHEFLPQCEQSGIPILADDVNKDGLTDVIWGRAHNYGLYWMEQMKSSTGEMGWLRHTIDDTWAQFHCPLLADMDGDGMKELVVGKRYRGHAGADPGDNEPLCIFMYKIERGASPKFTKSIVTYDENIGTGMNLTAIDIDGDGDMDLVAPGKTGLYLFTNQTKENSK